MAAKKKLSITVKSKPASLSGADHKAAREFYNGLRNRGLSHNAALGFLSNSHQETGGTFSPSKEQDLRRRGDKLGPASGVVQWEKPRYDELLKFAKKRGRPITKIKKGGEELERVYDLDTQLDFIAHELQHGKKSTARALENAKTPEEAAKIVQYTYEIDASSLIERGKMKDKKGNIIPFTDKERRNIEARQRRAALWHDVSHTWLEEDRKAAELLPDELRGSTPNPVEPKFPFSPYPELKSSIPSIDMNADPLAPEVPPVPNIPLSVSMPMSNGTIKKVSVPSFQSPIARDLSNG